MFPKSPITTVALRGIISVVLGTLLQHGLAVAQSTTQQPTGSPSGEQHSPSEMLIGRGDLLQVTVYGTDFDRQVRVSDAGEISLPLLGTARLDGLSIREAEELVGRQLAQRGYFNDPQVSIFDREYTTQAISVLGEVQKPGIYPLPGARTLFDAISAAGGTTDKAGNQVTITHRGQPKQPEVVALSYNGDSSVPSNVQVAPRRYSSGC